MHKLSRNAKSCISYCKHFLMNDFDNQKNHNNKNRRFAKIGFYKHIKD